MSDYQLFELDENGVKNVGARMETKMNALDLPDFTDKKVLDVGCDFGFWSFLSAEKGAIEVVGLDRGRPVNGVFTDTPQLNNRTAKQYGFPCEFYNFEVGKQWRLFGDFDIVFLMSLYHHIFQNCRDHQSIFYWLWWHTDEQVIWENPTSAEDTVVQGNVDQGLHKEYTKEKIFKGAERYFDIEYVGPALHSPTRDIYTLTPKNHDISLYEGKLSNGAGGASKAFTYNNNQRIKEINYIMGLEMYPGSLNVFLDKPFDWSTGYFRAKVSDVKDRSKGLDSEWTERWARFYPVIIDGNYGGYAFKFEGDTYPENFIEVISTGRIRDYVEEKVTVMKL